MSMKLPAGFEIRPVGSAAPYTDTADAKDLDEFFMVRRHRRCGVGEALAKHVWHQCPGEWVVRVMQGNLPVVLKTIAPVFLVVSALHLWLGLGAEVMLGALVPGQALSDPVLDSQNRFYGVAFGLYGVILFICAGDLSKYQTILRALLWVFLAAGAAWFASIARDPFAQARKGGRFQGDDGHRPRSHLTACRGHPGGSTPC